MKGFIDSPRAIRAGEELDVERLTAYLREKVPELGQARDVQVEQFPSGHSNLTYLLRAGDREYVLRRPPFGSKVKSAHDMGREHRILSKLHAVYPLAPEPVAFCDDESVIGGKFYVMRRIEGVIIRKELPPELGLDAPRLRTLHLNLVDNLARIHGLDYQKAGLGDLGKPDGYVERQVSGWTKRYADSQTDDIPAVTEVAKWLADHLPKESGSSLIHNDYKLDNVVLDPSDVTKIIGVLDWEMSTIGDPLMDLGTFVGYWIEPGDDDVLQAMRWSPTTQPGSLTRAEIVARYEQATGRTVPNPVYYYVFGMFKTAVVVQQIYYRYKQGLTRDPRFAALADSMRLLVEQARRTIAADHL
jgi:aminoglycoside phosphotransferase (APT) family kinase protein